MNELMIFNNSEFGEVRTVTIKNEPWFVGKDVADALGYLNSRDALSRHIDEEDKTEVGIHDGSQNRSMTAINESGLYSLILGSKLENAKKFKKWVTSEILPQIRKTGSYSPDVANLPPELQLMNALVQQMNTQALSQLKLETSIQETKVEIQAMRDAIVINPKAEWRKTTNQLLTKIGNKVNDYSAPRTEVYEALKNRANCRPDVLIGNLKKRALDNGMQPSKVKDLNILDVLENDTRLREIYISIVKEMAIKKGVA